ncbi:MAG: hypothetical protein NZL96_01815 [Patescibacteria group bacterium]|nr:hypothetical protein [Patescibacteria group bacterium]
MINIAIFFFILTRGLLAQESNYCKLRVYPKDLLEINVIPGSRICLYSPDEYFSSRYGERVERTIKYDTLHKLFIFENQEKKDVLSLVRTNNQRIIENYFETLFGKQKNTNEFNELVKKSFAQYYFCTENGFWEIRDLNDYCENSYEETLNNSYSRSSDIDRYLVDIGNAIKEIKRENKVRLSIRNSKSENSFESENLVNLESRDYCVVDYKDYQFFIEDKNKFCIGNKIYECDTEKYPIVYKKELPGRIKEKYSNYTLYSAKLTEDCEKNTIQNRCNKPLRKIPIFSHSEKLFCVKKEEVDPISSISSDVKYEYSGEDTFGVNCGIGNSSFTYSPESKCCNFGLEDGLDNVVGNKLAESLNQTGCLINTEILNSPVRILCFGEIIAGILNLLNLDTLVLNSPFVVTTDRVGPCREGYPVIPKDKLNHSDLNLRPTYPDYPDFIIATGPADFLNPNCQCVIFPNNLSKFCEKYTFGRNRLLCYECTKNGKMYTALGCLNVNLSGFLREELFPRALGMAGLIGFFCVIYSAFKLQTSRGSPEQIKKSQELLTSCISGLILVIFSVLVLRFIGVDILGLPGIR